MKNETTRNVGLSFGHEIEEYDQVVLVVRLHFVNHDNYYEIFLPFHKPPKAIVFSAMHVIT